MADRSGAVVDDDGVSETTDRPDDRAHPDATTTSAAEPDETATSSAGADDAAPRRRRTVGLLVAVGATILVADVLTKVLAVAQLEPARPVRLLGGAVYLTLIRNPGAAFGIATGMTWLLTVVAVVVVVVIARMARKLRSAGWAWGLGLVLGGALGNLVDRLLRAPGVLQGHVVDYVSLFAPDGSVWPIFNVADSAIVCGGVLLVALALLGREPDGTRSGEREAAEKQAAEREAAEKQAVEEEPAAGRAAEDAPAADTADGTTTGA